MKYRRLGQSGLKVSEIALGSWLTYGAAVADNTAEETIRRAYDIGINFFDTANAYNQGAAEKVVGEVLRDYPRDTYVLATKAYFPMGEWPTQRGLSRKHLMEQCEQSLKRLGLDYIDIYQCHRFDPETDLEETVRALDDLVTQGKVLYVGVSEWSAAQIQEAVHLEKTLGLHRMVSNQPIYNMLVRYIEKDVIPVSQQYGIGQIVFSPLAQGILTGKYRPGQPIPANTRAADDKSNHWIKSYLNDEVLQGVDRLRTLAEGEGMSLAQLALAWVLRQPGVSSAIIGASRPAQVDENAKACDFELSDGLLGQVEAILKAIPAEPVW